MKKKLLILSTRIADKGTVTASNEFPTLVASNVLDQEPSRVWRSAPPIEQYIDFILPQAVAVDTAAIEWPFGTLSSSALMRLIGYATGADVGITSIIDSGWKSVWPNGYKHHDPDWGPEVGMVEIDNQEAYRYWRIMVTDPDAPFGYLDIGRATVDKALRFKINPRIDGSLGFIPIDVQEANGYGQIFTDPRPYQQRQMNLVWSTMDHDSVMKDASELTRLRGQAGDFFVFLNPGEEEFFHKLSMQAIFEGQHKFVPVATWISGPENKPLMGWAFTLTLNQKL